MAGLHSTLKGGRPSLTASSSVSFLDGGLAAGELGQEEVEAGALHVVEAQGFGALVNGMDVVFGEEKLGGVGELEQRFEAFCRNLGMRDILLNEEAMLLCTLIPTHATYFPKPSINIQSGINKEHFRIS